MELGMSRVSQPLYCPEIEMVNSECQKMSILHESGPNCLAKIFLTACFSIDSVLDGLESTNPSERHRPPLE